MTYRGRVQNVGFRATAVSIARGYPVTGWVRNRPDGRVELLAEGSPEAVVKFLAAVRSQWQGYIEEEQAADEPPTGRFRSFDIVR